MASNVFCASFWKSPELPIFISILEMRIQTSCVCLRCKSTSRYSISFPSTDNKGKMNCVNCGSTLGDFPQIEAHFLVQTWFRTRWYEAYFSAKLRAALCESTDLVFYSSPTGQLAVFISWHHPDGVSVLCWGTRLNSTIVYHPVF